MQPEPTTQDILDALQTFSSHVDEQFGKVNEDMTAIRSVMVTKDYLDDKMADLRGDLVTLVRKEDRKLAAVVDEPVKRSIFDEPTARRIFELEPFARM